MDETCEATACKTIVSDRVQHVDVDKGVLGAELRGYASSTQRWSVEEEAAPMKESMDDEEGLLQ